MPQYEAVPIKERYAQEQSTAPSECNMHHKKASKAIQAYAQVPDDDDEQTQEREKPDNRLCIHPYVLTGPAFFLASCFLTTSLFVPFLSGEGRSHDRE